MEIETWAQELAEGVVVLTKYSFIQRQMSAGQIHCKGGNGCVLQEVSKHKMQTKQLNEIQ